MLTHAGRNGGQCSPWHPWEIMTGDGLFLCLSLRLGLAGRGGWQPRVGGPSNMTRGHEVTGPVVRCNMAPLRPPTISHAHSEGSEHVGP